MPPINEFRDERDTAALSETRSKANDLGVLDITPLVKSVEEDPLDVSGGFGFIRRDIIEYDPTDPTDESTKKLHIEVAIKTLKVIYSVKSMWDYKVSTSMGFQISINKRSSAIPTRSLSMEQVGTQQHTQVHWYCQSPSLHSASQPCLASHEEWECCHLSEE